VGKLLKLLGVLFLVLIVLAVAGLFLAHSSGAKAQREFFETWASGDVDKVMALMHPSLEDEIDEPVLRVFLARFNDRLGAFKGLSKANFHTSVKTENGVTIKTSKGEVLFEKGTATSKLVYRDGKIVEFDVESEAMGDDWFPQDFDTSLYEARGKAFLEAILSGRPDDGHAMMHENLQKEVPAEKLRQMMDTALGRVGKLKSVEFDSKELEVGKSPKLRLYYRVANERGSTKSVVLFQFVGLKGHLIMFDLAPGQPAS
jgi:hypothetical protein